MDKRDPSCTVGVSKNWYRDYGKQYGGSPPKLEIELPCDPATPLLGIYPPQRNENRISKTYLHPHVHGSIIHDSQDMETP